MPVPAAILSEPARRFATATCRAWLAAGLVLLAFVPAARGAAEWLGWLPFWLLVAPLLVLAQVEALDGFRASAAWVSRSRRALRRRTWRGQARRIARPAARRAVSG
ncbi:MAG: hypothetical protein LW860_12190 [Xanthomonadaceae bacterium]|jgi:hypothetical protein|nr:hypothetical protein [Xanthomonadaceae bacterium]